MQNMSLIRMLLFIISHMPKIGRGGGEREVVSLISRDSVRVPRPPMRVMAALVAMAGAGNNTTGVSGYFS